MPELTKHATAWFGTLFTTSDQAPLLQPRSPHRADCIK